MFGETRETETVLGPVIQAGMEALKVTFITFFPRHLKLFFQHLCKSSVVCQQPLWRCV